MALISQPNPEKQTDFGKAAQEAREKIKPVDCETRFSTDPDKNCEMLGKAMSPDDAEKQEYYKGMIIASLEKHLKPGMSIHDLWAYCASEFCQTTAIVEGLLRFFAGEKGEKEINISKYLNPLEYEATSTEEKTDNAIKNRIHAQTRNELSALLAEIKSAQV